MDMGHNPVKKIIPSVLVAAVTFDDLLVAVGENHDRDAFVRLFEHYAPRVKSFLMKGGLTPEQADEVAQETMLTVWQKAPSYDPKRAAAGTWIFTIARNRRIDLQRKNKHTGPMPEEHDMPAATDLQPGEAMEQSQDTRALSAAIDNLPDEQADLIRRAFLEDKTHQDIAAETGLPLGTIKSRIRLGLGKLRENLKGLQP
jgi:RNA polymerase sigma-70 factor (ECF subfamily)